MLPGATVARGLEPPCSVLPMWMGSAGTLRSCSQSTLALDWDPSSWLDQIKDLSTVRFGEGFLNTILAGQHPKTPCTTQ